MHRLLIATNNKGKVQELRALLRPLPVELLTPHDLDLDLKVVEDGHTYSENASKKAMAFANASRMISLADDSGLEVEALDGDPGLHSARYLSIPGATDADRRAYLLDNLRSNARPWMARFRASIAIAAPGEAAEWAEGECPGEIIPEERGTGGFGYDPIFLVEGTGQTMAELSLEQKNRLSHRARAVMNALPILERLLRR